MTVRRRRPSHSLTHSLTHKKDQPELDSRLREMGAAPWTVLLARHARVYVAKCGRL